MNCIFCQIINQQLPSNICYQDDKVIVINDLAPQAPLHQLIIPKKHISTLNHLEPDDSVITSHMISVATQQAKVHRYSDEGYRLVFNCNELGGQTVFHIHLHLLAGRSLSWPPG